MRGLDLDVLYDATGKQYALGRGLHVWVDGVHVGEASPAPLPLHGSVGLPSKGATAAEMAPPRVRVSWDARRFHRCKEEYAARLTQSASWWEC